jgi:hypothetical protein
VGHTSFVTKESSEVHWLGWVILWERLDLAAVTRGTLARQEAERTMARRLEFAVRLDGKQQTCNVTQRLQQYSATNEPFTHHTHTRMFMKINNISPEIPYNMPCYTQHQF